MDETTKVIIATLSGFIIAFFAEPVKNYFQNKANLHNLRIALYKEMLNNYFVLEVVTEHDVVSNDMRRFLANLIRTECYKHCIQNEITLFYQLEEANRINVLYNALSEKIILKSNIPDISASDFLKGCQLFCDIYTQTFDKGTFSGKIIRELVSKNQYQEIMRRGRQVSQAKDNGVLPPAVKP
jgi:phage FluMu protein gp41